jgi:hypothetical protein
MQLVRDGHPRRKCIRVCPQLRDYQNPYHWACGSAHYCPFDLRRFAIAEMNQAMPSLLSPHGKVSTQDISPGDRIGFWEAHNASHLIGLRCSTHAKEGLCASEIHYDLGDVQLTEISGNQHVIERPRDMLSTHPKDSIFACMLLRGEAFFYQGDECILLSAGDVIVYSTDAPYLYGFSTEMQQVVVECDASTLLGANTAERPKKVIKADRSAPHIRALVVDFKAAVLGFIKAPEQAHVEDVSRRCRAALHVLVTRRPLASEGLNGEEATAKWRRVQAETYILDNIVRPSLSATEVAESLGITVRHLNRLFQQNNTSPTEWIWMQRVMRAE